MKVSVYIATSLDGFIARLNGALDWLPGSDGETPQPDSASNEQNDFGYYDFMNSVDTLVMGRNTYEFVQSIGQWPYANKRVIVLSSTLTRLPDKSPATVELKCAQPLILLNELKQTGASHVYIDGGKTIQGFLRAGLINELIITRVPILIGSGIPLFGQLDQDIELKHINSTSFNNGFVQSTYIIQ